MRGKNDVVEFDQQWISAVGKAMESWVREKLVDEQTVPDKIQYRLGVTTHGKRPGNVIGETLPASMSDEGAVQIIIRFDQDDRDLIALNVLHQLIHAVTGPRHDVAFHHMALRLQFEDKKGIRSPVATKELADRISALVKEVGDLPFRRVRYVVEAKKGEVVADRPKKQPTRLISAKCEVVDDGEPCGFLTQVTKLWLLKEGYGAPLCPRHKVPLKADVPDEVNDNAAEETDAA